MPAAAELALEVTRERLVGRGRYMTKIATTEEEIAENRRLATRRYLDVGKIDPETVGSDGLPKVDAIHDAGLATYISTYDSQRDGRLVSVGKLLWKPGVEAADLRTPLADLYPAARERLFAHAPGTLGELGSLAKERGVSQVATLGVLREVYRLAEERGIEAMVAGLEAHAWPRYKQLFGSGIERMHPEDVLLKYKGFNSDQVGIYMDITNAYQEYRHDTLVGSLADRVARLLVIEYYAQRVPSFHSLIPLSQLR